MLMSGNRRPMMHTNGVSQAARQSVNFNNHRHVWEVIAVRNCTSADLARYTSLVMPNACSGRFFLFFYFFLPTFSIGSPTCRLRTTVPLTSENFSVLQIQTLRSTLKRLRYFPYHDVPQTSIQKGLLSTAGPHLLP